MVIDFVEYRENTCVVCHKRIFSDIVKCGNCRRSMHQACGIAQHLIVLCPRCDAEEQQLLQEFYTSEQPEK